VRFGNLLDISGVSGRDLWAVGTVRDLHPRMLIEHFDGVRWTVVPGPVLDSPYVALGAVRAIGPGDVWAVGSYLGAEGTDQPLAVRFDGSAWSLVAVPSIPGGAGALDDVEAVGPATVWMVGHSTDGTASRTLALRWTPRGWTVTRTPDRGIDDALHGLGTDGHRRLVAVGAATDARETMRTLVEVYGGRAWHATRSPNPPASALARLWDVAVNPDGSAWAVGEFTPDSVGQTLIMSC
jgi:hypothetical protein